MSAKKSKKGKIIGIVVIVVVLFIIIGANGKSTTAHATSNTSKTSSTQTKVFKLGESVQMGNYNITVNSISNSNKIEENGFALASTQNNFSIVKLTLENTTNNPIAGFWLGNNDKLITLSSDNNNYTVDFNESSTANSAYNSNNAFNIFVGSQLSPHTKYTCYVVFTTPHPIKNGALTVNMGQTTAKINL